MLSPFLKSEAQWTEIARNCSWNTLRMNLNTFQRHGVYNNGKVVEELAAKLADPKLVAKFNVFPYELFTAYRNTEGVPMPLRLALQDAMEVATRNVPVLAGKTAVLVDSSGSMRSPVTGNRGYGATTVTKCVDVAALMAACVVRANSDTKVLLFDTSVYPITLNPRDSVMTNAEKLNRNGGGTDCAAAMRHLNAISWKGDNVIMISDNESWYNPYGSYYGRATGLASEWSIFQKKNSKAKLVCVDIQAGSTAQVTDNNRRLNVGGFSDSVFTIVANFINGDTRNFVQVIKDSVNLDEVFMELFLTDDED
jgi:60 kDa SS-A/Ro ribonucleoprotein